jgi:hypothetical protein
MPAKRLSMRKIREVLRLRAQGLSDREIARVVGSGRTTVARIRLRAEEVGLSWPPPEGLSDSALEALLYPPIPHPSIQPRAMPQWSYIHQELRRPAVTLQLLWLEYKATHPESYQYSRFCALYNAWKDTLDPVLMVPRSQLKVGGPGSLVFNSPFASGQPAPGHRDGPSGPRGAGSRGSSGSSSRSR